MIIKLFDLSGGKIIASEHCYSLKTLKDIMDKYPDSYLKMYQYLFYMSCPNPEINPFFNTPSEEKEEIVLKEIQADFTSETDLIPEALIFCKKLYETPTYRAYQGIRAMLDRLALFMTNTPITTGRDGNGPFLISAAKEYKNIRESYKAAYSDHMEEQGRLRGGSASAYDQK